MLPAPVRMRTGTDFDRAVSQGRRCGRRTLVVHLLERVTADHQASDLRKAGGATEPGHCPQAGDDVVDDTPRVGFVVSRKVGSSVARHRVQRRLRHAAREIVGDLRPGTLLVVRANASAVDASWEQLRRDLQTGLARARAASGKGGRP